MTELGPSLPNELPINQPTHIELPTDIPEGSEPLKWRDVVGLGIKDFREASGLSKLAVAAAIGVNGYELGPGGNETTAPAVFGFVAERVDGVFPGSLLAAAATAGFIAAEQYAGGRLAMKSVKSFPSMSESALSLINSKRKNTSDDLKFKSFEDLSFSRRLSYALTGGTGFTVTREAFAVGIKDQKRLARVNRVSTFMTATAVGGLVGAVDATDRLTDNEAVHTVTGLIKNPLIWIAILSSKVGFDVFRARSQRKRHDAQQ